MAVRKKRVGKTKGKITAWSYSRWSTYDNCPKQAYYNYIEKIETKPSKPMIRGSKIHKDGELYLKGTPRKMDPVWDDWIELLDVLVEKGAKAEDDWAFDYKWSPTDWFGPSAWCRARTDAHHFGGKTDLHVIDFKTGKIYADKHTMQRSLYGVAGLCRYPDIKKVTVEFWYLDQGELLEEDFTTKQLELLQADWNRRGGTMLSDEEFKPTPSENACRFCDFHKRKGGPCADGK